MEAIFHGFAIADRFVVVTEGRVDLRRVVIDVSKVVVNSRKVCDGVRGEHIERLQVVLFGLRKVTEALIGRPISPSCVTKPLVSNTAQLPEAFCPADAIVWCE